MKTIFCLIFASLAVSGSASAQAITATVSSPSGVILCSFGVGVLSSDFSALASGSTTLSDQPLSIKRSSDKCTEFFFSSAVTKTLLPQIQFVIPEVSGTTQSNVTITLTNVGIKSITLPGSLDSVVGAGPATETLQLLPTKLKVSDSLTGTTVTCDFTAGLGHPTCS